MLKKLKTTFTALAASVILTLGMGAANANETQTPRDAVYRIGGYLSGGHCSAVAVGPRLLLTAEHCVARGLSLQIQKFDSGFKEVGQQQAMLKVVRSNEKYDQALFEVLDSSVDLNWIRVCKNELEEKDFGIALRAVGYPLVISKFQTKGSFQGYMDIDHLLGGEFEPFYLADMPIAGGNSGGGLFKLEQTDKGYFDWCLQGIATANTYRMGYETMSWFSTLKGIQSTTSGVLLEDSQLRARAEFQNRITNPSDEK